MLNVRIITGLVLAASVVSAQLADLPDCAVSPALAALGGQSKCQVTDFDCICSDSSLMQSLSASVQKACTNPGDLETAKSAAAALCATGVKDVAAATTAATSSSEASASAVGGSESSSVYLTVPTAAPYYAGNATAIHYSTGAGVASASATGSAIVTDGPVKAAGASTAYVHKDGLALCLAAVIGIMAFF